MRHSFLSVFIFLALIPFQAALALEQKNIKEPCGNTFFWDELKSRTLCDIGNSPIACIPLNALGSALLGSGAYKMGFAGANAVESTRAINVFKEADRLKAIEKTSKTIGGHARLNADGMDSLSSEERTRLRGLHDSMFERAEAANADLLKLSKSPYFSPSFETMRFMKSDFETPHKSQSTGSSSEQANLVKLYNEYNNGILKIAALKNRRFLNVDDDKETLSQQQRTKLDAEIKEWIQKTRELRPQVLKAYGNTYKGAPTIFSKKMAGAASAIGMAAAFPLVELLKEPAKRALCGFNSTETGDAMANIGAVAVLDKNGCRIEIPSHQVFALSMQDEKTLDSLPKPICTALKNQLEAMRNRQEKERPVINGSPKCTSDGFYISMTIRDRKYNHEYKRAKDGALTLKASFIPEVGDRGQLKNLPGGEERFNFSVNALDSGARWSNLTTSLPQWNTFTAGDPLLSKTQGLPDAIQYYQNAGDKQSPPTTQEARNSLASGAMSLNYIYSVGEQLTAANKYLPAAIEYCASELKPDPKKESENPATRKSVR